MVVKSTDEAKEALATDTQELARQMKVIQKDLAALTEALKVAGYNQVDNLTGTVRDAVDQASRSVRLTAAEARHRGELAAEEVEAAIARNPVTAVLVALGLGFVAGALSRR